MLAAISNPLRILPFFPSLRQIKDANKSIANPCIPT